jgi:hypothetical protein
MVCSLENIDMLPKSHKRSASPKAQHRELRFSKHGIYAVGDNKVRHRIADPIMVKAFATSCPGMGPEQAFTQIRFLDRRAKWKTEIVPSSMLTAQTGEFISLLSRRGYSWPANKKLWLRIISALSISRPDRDIQVTPVPGWHGDTFVLPGESYGPNGPDRKKLQVAHNPTVRMGEFGRAGKPDEWKSVAKKCVHSTRARLAVATNFAAPNLRMLGLNSFGFNFSGMTSGGKTLLLRLAASAAGLNRDGGPGTWDGTPTGFEQRVQGHRDCILPLDDISYLEGDPTKMVKLITFRLAGNRAKDKAGQYVVAQNLVEVDSRVIALSTSEDLLWAHLDKAGRRRIRGEEVRMINVRACVSDMEDIFDGPRASEVVGDTVEERRRFVEELERDAGRFQGEAFRAYLTKRAADKGALAALDAYMKDYIADAPLPWQQRWLARIQRLFAAVYASAAQAIDYGILPWNKKATLRAIKACMYDAMKQLIMASGEAPAYDAHSEQSDESLLAEFKQHVEGVTFVNLKPNSPKNGRQQASVRHADGIVRPTKPGKVKRLLFGRTFDAWFPEVAARKRLTKLLRSKGIFSRGRRSDTSTRQVQIAELGGRVPCYVLRRKGLGA